MIRSDYVCKTKEILKNECLKGNHRLEKIYESGSDMESAVVRWCSVCGSVVVDADYDGRTQPGAIIKMKSPAISKALSYLS